MLGPDIDTTEGPTAYQADGQPPPRTPQGLPPAQELAQMYLTTRDRQERPFRFGDIALKPRGEDCQADSEF
jgi:hypothetical protein